MDAARSTPPTIDVAFLFLGLPHSQLAGPLRVSQNIAYRTSSAVRYHVVADQAADVLSRQLRLQSRQPWFVHSILKAAPRVEALHSALCARGCAGLNCCKYMWKPLFHLLLPRWVPAVILLDADLFLMADVAQLWAQFDTFTPEQLAGFAEEQSPWNRKVERLGGFSVNGGVQLLRLRAMRQGTFTQLLWRYARSDLPLDGSTGLGVIGDQTLYSWMSINNTPAQKHIARLPCSWNVQVGAWPSTVGHGERRWGKACASGCKLLHGNGAWGKLLLHPILNDPSGRSCRRIFERWLGTSHYRKGSMSEKLLNRTGRECCPTLPAEASSSAGSGSGSMAGSRLRHGLRSRVAGGVVAGSASAAGRDEAADALWREAQRRYPGARQPG